MAFRYKCFQYIGSLLFFSSFLNGSAQSGVVVKAYEKAIRIEASSRFSPNGDGQNDVFTLGIVSTRPYTFHFEVKDVKNKVVFASTETTTWKGTKKNKKKKVKEGLYNWKAIVTLKTGEEYVHEGTVEVDR